MHDATRRDSGVLAVVDDGQARDARVLQGVTEQRAVGDRRAVVAERDAARLRQLRQLGQLVAFAALADGPDRQHPHRGIGGGTQDVLDGRARIDRWLGVRHAADRGEAAAGRRLRAGGDRLLVLEAGVAQVAVEVDETGADDEAGGVDRLRPVGSQVRPDGGDAPVGDEEVAHEVDVPSRVEDASVTDEQLRRHAFHPSCRYRRRGS